MSVESFPRPAFEVVQAEFFLELLMCLFADPARFDGAGQLLDRRVGRQVREVVLAFAGRAMLAHESDWTCNGRPIAFQSRMFLGIIFLATVMIVARVVTDLRFLLQIGRQCCLSGTWSSTRSRQARRMIGFAGWICQCFARILPITATAHPLQRNDPVRVPTGTTRRAQSKDANEEVVLTQAASLSVSPCMSGGCMGRVIEQFAGLEHSVHDNCQFWDCQ